MKTQITFALVGLALAAAASSTALGQEGGGREQLPVATPDMPVQRIVYRRSMGEQDGGAAQDCPQQQSSLTGASFSGGSYIVQAGFIEQEVAAATYTVPASAFPIRLDMMEMIFATSNASVQTTTKWSVIVWQGTPATGTQIFTVSSDGELLPHLVMPPGTTGTNIQFMIDPSDPDQIYIQDDGSHQFSIGYRIDQHNAPGANQCVTAPPSNMNAFPTTDTNGLQYPALNWIKMRDCGIFGCGVGWKTFQQIPQLCRPSGDWVMRATWTSLGNCGSTPTGACCEGTSCSSLTLADCQLLGGVYRGDGVACTTSTCAPGPCCFAATGGCISLPATDCAAAGGIAGPAGVSCASYTCFPTGACCLPDGTCAGPMSPSQCAALGGTYKGNNSTCGTVTCPPPTGAACFPNGFCLVLTQADALAAGATWAGPGTTCADTNANGIPDACESAAIVGDLNHDGKVNGADLGMLLANWGNAGVGDLDGNGSVSGADLGILLTHWTG
jgi:hypothetical protein